MKIILVNLISTLKKYKLATAFNLLGLSVAFAAFTVIMMQVDYQRNFDKMHPTSDRVYRATFPEVDGVFSVIQPRPFIEELIHSSPHIEAGTLIFPFGGNIYYSVSVQGEDRGFRDPFFVCSPGITKVFGIEMVEGLPDCLSNPDNAIIPKSFADKLFGNESAIGKVIHCQEQVPYKDRRDLVIGGVYKDFSANTQLQNGIYTAIAEDLMMNQWYASNFLCYLLLDDKANAKNVTDNFNSNFDFSNLEPEGYKLGRNIIELTPFTEIYFKDENIDGNIVKSGSPQTVKLITTIAFLLIAIAAINFINFSTSLAPKRIRSINTQKVLGCPTITLRFSLLIESLCLTFISFLLGILYISILDTTSLLSFIEADINPFHNIHMVAFSATVALIIGLLAGIYPAFYMTSFPPALVLKGNFGLTPSGQKLRTALISIQFIISIGLIIGASFIWLQNNYMQNFSLGFDKEQIAVVELNREFYKNHKEKYVSELKSFPGIEGVAFSAEKLGSSETYNTTSLKYGDGDEDGEYFVLMVSPDFIDVMGIEVVEGRNPMQTAADTAIIPFLFNIDAKHKYELQIGDKVGGFSSFSGKSLITGFTDNVKFTSLRMQNDNIAFVIYDGYTMPISYVRLAPGTDYFKAIDNIRETISDIDPSFPVKIEFYDMLFDQVYHKEENLRKMVTVFCLIAILISIVGVFGTVIFEVEYRRREIGLRKVFGATITEVLNLFNLLYIRIILICFVIAVPLVYYLISEWLQNFYHATPIYWWVFLISGLIVLTVTVLIVNIQSWRAANANPVDSIKNE